MTEDTEKTETTEKTDNTKTRLIEAAGEVFARRGYRATTVREICRIAKTHIGAVNYHFRDKKGLYTAVLEYSCQSAAEKYPHDMGLSEESTAAEKLRAFILSMLLRLIGEGFPAWHGTLIAQEIADPTGALDQMMESTIRPKYDYISGIVRELLRGENPRFRNGEDENAEAVHLCVTSVMGQCLHHHISRHIISILRPGNLPPQKIERLVDHITRFSIGGIREIASGDAST